MGKEICLPCRVRSLGGEDPMEEEMTTHSSVLAWRIPVDRGAWWATVCGVAESDLLKHTQSELFDFCSFMCVCVCVCVFGTYLKSCSPSLFPGGKFLGILVNERAWWLLGSSVGFRWRLNSDALAASDFNLEAS